MITLVEAIFNHLFGRRYFVVVEEKPAELTADGEAERFLSSFIFRNREDAEWFMHDLKYGRSVKSVEIVSFRSRNEYKTHDDSWKINIKR